MIKMNAQVGESRIEYFQKGENPVWLMYSGTHGDEADVVLSIEKYVAEHAEKLPDFVWVPHVSPSAVQAKVRHNARGLDTNRNFFDDSTEDEILANLQILKGKNFEYFLDFHEDPERNEFYVYDSSGVRDEFIQTLLRAQQELGINLWHGIDDENDPALGAFVDNGFCDASHISESSGQSLDYLVSKGIITKRAWTFETPGLLAQEQKDKIVHKIFEHLQTCF